jgi:hypothetical protein
MIIRRTLQNIFICWGRASDWISTRMNLYGWQMAIDTTLWVQLQLSFSCLFSLYYYYYYWLLSLNTTQFNFNWWSSNFFNRIFFCVFFYNIRLVLPLHSVQNSIDQFFKWKFIHFLWIIIQLFHLFFVTQVAQNHTMTTIKSKKIVFCIFWK